MKVPSRNSVFLTGNCAGILVAVLAMGVLLVSAERAQAVPISIKLTSDALGLGSSDINKGKTVNPDVLGKLITSPNTGEGSILYIQADGKAGSDPLLVAITAGTRLDVTGDLLLSHDYQAGVLYISKEKKDLPDGKKEGLGVRVFKVDKKTGLRKVKSQKKKKSGKWGLAKIEGSKEVSGGGKHKYDVVNFDFDPLWLVDAQSVEVLLSKFDPKGAVGLHIELTSGSTFDYGFLQTSDTSIFEQVGTDKDKLWKLKFSGIDDLQMSNLMIANFEVRSAAKHFLITGITVDAVPEPATVALLGLGSLSLLRRRKSR